MCILSIPPKNIKKQIMLNYKLKQYIRKVYLNCHRATDFSFEKHFIWILCSANMLCTCGTGQYISKLLTRVMLISSCIHVQICQKLIFKATVNS